MAITNSSDKNPRDIQISTAMTVGRASVLMAAMIALSRITGFGRLILTSYLYGRGPITDAYNAAFNIPDTITIIIAGGALATGFVPVFTEYLAHGQEEAARRTFRAMFTLLGAAFGIITIVLLVLTYTPFGTLLAPHKVQPQYIALYLSLLRILLLAQFIFVIGGMFSGTLNALRLFWFPALQPVMFNLGIIILGIWRPPILGTGYHSIQSQAWGALVGACVGSLIIQMPAVLRNGLSLRPLWDLQDPGVRRVLRSLLPIVLGLASGQIIALSLPRFFAVGLPAGDLTALDNANRLMQVPLDLIASGPAIALFPTLSLLSAQGKVGELRVHLAAALRRTLLLTVLASALLMALGFSAIHLLLEHGQFSKVDTKFTAQALWYYSFCIVGLGAQQMLARGFYAMQDTRAPIIIGVGAMLLFCGFGAYMMFETTMGAPGLALAAAMAISILAIWMWLTLNKKLEGWDSGATLTVLVKSLVAGVATYFAALYVARYANQWITVSGYDSKLTPGLVKIAARSGVLLIGAIAGTVAFGAVALLLRISELEPFTHKLMRRRRSTRLFEQWRP